MGNLVLNLDAQLWCFDIEDDVKKFEIEKISPTKLKRFGIIFFSCWTTFLVTEVVADPIVVYKNGKKLNNFFDTPESVLTFTPRESFPLHPGNILLLFTFLNSLRESKITNETLAYLRAQQLNELKKKELLITLVVQGGEIAKSIILASYALSIFVLAVSIYLGKKEEMKDHFKTLGKKRTQVFIIELLTLILSLVISDWTRLVKIVKSRQIQIDQNFFFSSLSRSIIAFILVVIVQKYGPILWWKTVETWEEWPRILHLITDFITNVYDGDWTYKLRRKKLLINTARLRKELSLEKRHPRLTLKDWLKRTSSILIAEGRIKDYENALRRDLLGRLQFWWFIFKENQKLKTPLSDLEWFFVLILLYNKRL